MSLNDRVALAKGWTLNEELHICSADRGYAPSHWRDPEGIPAPRPNFTKSLYYVAGMMRKLNKPRSIWDKTHRWSFYWDRVAKQFVCEERVYVPKAAPAFRIQTGRSFFSPPDRPGDCVGEALLSVFGKEA